MKRTLHRKPSWLRLASRHAFSILGASALVSCGTQQVREIHTKEYRLRIDGPATSSQRETLRSLIDTFNRDAGFDAIEWSEGSSDANSTITLVPGLNEGKDGKLGWGQWTTFTSSDIEREGLVPVERRSVTYSLSVQLDKAFFDAQAATAKDGGPLYLLLCHELGHGFQLEHNPDTRNVMYAYIGSPKDKLFEDFFARVRHFFGRD